MTPIGFTPQALHFQGRPLARYQAENVNRPDKPKTVTVYDLEPKDLPVLKRLLRQAKEKTLPLPAGTANDVDAHYENLEAQLLDAITLLTMRKKQGINSDGTVIQLAVADNKPCGLLVGNMPKLVPADLRMTRSSRDRDRETEMDWLVTWPTAAGQKLRGIGQILTAQFFQAAQELDVDSIYITSDTEDTSKAPGVYKQMGFRQIGNRRVPWQTEDGPRPLTYFIRNEKFEADDWPEYPMQISTADARTKAAERMAHFQREALDGQASVNLAKTLDAIA